MANPFSNPLLFNPRRKVPEISVTQKPRFRFGLITASGPRDIPRGATPDSLNWQVKGDSVELRRGQAFLGTTSVQTGNGMASGLRKITDALQVEHLVGSFGKKLKYFDIPTSEWIEIGSDLLGANVVGPTGIASENISISEYVSLAGNQVWVNSPNCAGYFKIMTANLGNAVDQYNVSKNFKGWLKIDAARTLLWGKTNDKTSPYGSYIDSQTYTTVAAETAYTGNGIQTAFSGYNLVQATGKQTVFAISVTGGGITFSDNYNGLLTGSDGSTGTINYATGAITLNFISAPSGAINVAYQWEDSTSGGIADFTKSTPRTAGQGFVFPQGDGGGPLQNMLGYNGTYYCMHLKKTWALVIGQTDTSATNLPYRNLVGIPNQRAAVETGEGIYYIDDRDPTNIKVRLLTLGRGSAVNVIPVPLSNNLILNNYNFDQAASTLWGDLVLFACRQTTSTVNDRVLVYNKLYKSWEIHDYNVSCFEVYNGTLICGDAVTNNFITLFSGWDDLGSVIDNYWTGNLDKLDLDGLKATKYLYLEGDIAPDQAYDVYLSLDAGDFVKVGSISGRANYVDKNQSVAIGGTTLGAKLIGGNLTEPSAYHYEYLMRVNTAKFEYCQIKFIATGIGYVSVRNYRHWDWRYKGKSVPLSKRSQVVYPYNFPSYHSTLIQDEILNTQGIGPVFTLASTPITGTESLFRGGVQIFSSAGDYTISGSTITLSSSLGTNEKLTADYYTNGTQAIGTAASEELDLQGAGTTFTLTHTPLTGTLTLTRGGLRITVGNGDYTVSGTTITLSSTLSVGESLQANYSYN